MLDIALIALATFYAAYVLTSTSGPFDVFKAIRNRLPLGGLTKCLPCACIWFALIFKLLYLVLPDVVALFAVAGLVVLAWRYTGGSANV